MSQAPTTSTQPATLDDLMRHDGKAELISGRIVPLMATGYRPNLIAKYIVQSLDQHAEAIGQGVVFTDNMGFAVDELLSGRESFSPDAAFYMGPLPANEMDFVTGCPVLAVEVRSKNDYGPAAERAMIAKRADYFEAGAVVVWDVDYESKVVRSYSRIEPATPEVFGPGQLAHAETALPGWRLAVDFLFR